MKKILVWLSWGVDSAVSAYLLKEQGYEVACGFMINYIDEENESCPTRVDLEEARLVAEYLNLPFYTFDYREEYEKRIGDFPRSILVGLILRTVWYVSRPSYSISLARADRRRG